MGNAAVRAALASIAAALLVCAALAGQERARIGRESAVPVHLADGAEERMPAAGLIEHGRRLFSASWNEEDGAGRPLTRGTGEPLRDPSRPLRGARAFNRFSGPDANSCRGCHNAPFGIAGGNGDFVTSGLSAAETFDFVTFDPRRPGERALAAIGNARTTPGLFGAGYLEMLARQLTLELQRTRDLVRPGESRPLAAEGISFGTISRRRDGSWNTAGVEGLPARSIEVTGRLAKPSLTIQPWRQSVPVTSLRELTNTAYNQHLGIQTSERFGTGADADGDGVVDEMTRADVTAVVLFLATLPVPGRVIPNDPAVEAAVEEGEQTFERIGCATCHVPALRLERRHWIYSEAVPPGAKAGTRRPRDVRVDLTSASLPQPRLTPPSAAAEAIDVPAYTDFKLHDITDPADATAGATRRFLTRRLWGAGNQSPYFHHGAFTTIRRAVLAHSGEALEQRLAFERLEAPAQDAVIEFLKSLQVLPPSARAAIVDERGQPRAWPRARQVR
jgi:hypothetical protein